MPTLTVYTKPNCPLCDEAMAEIEQARRQFPFELSEINILEYPEEYERYKHAIPVVTLDGVELFRYRLSCDELLRKIPAASRTASTARSGEKSDPSPDSRERKDSERKPSW